MKKEKIIKESDKMKRITKNIITIVTILLMLVLVFLTMNYAKNHIESTNNGPENMSGNMPEIGENTNNNMTPPDKPDGDNQNGMEEPPEKPDGDSQNSMEEPPEKPDGDNQNSMEEPPAKPEDNNDTSSTNDNQNNKGMPAIPSENMPNMNNAKSLTIIYYIVFGIECLVIALLIIHLIMSNLNKKTIKETYQNKDKILITILGTILLGATLTYLSTVITTNNFLNSTTQNGSNNNIQNNQNISYSASTTIAEDTTITEGEYTSANKDENAILVDSTNATISNVTVEKEGDSDGGDTTSFYGTNSAILAKGGANLTLNNVTINTNATGANGVFSYGGSATTNNSSSDGTTITISNSKITTKKDNSGGIMTTGGGTMIANNLEITTEGTSSAAIRTDRGGGTVKVTKGTYKTLGQGSPTIYSTADITVSDATLLAEASEGIVIEGKNSVSIDNCTLEDSNTKLNGKSTTYKNIFIYQSMSGDAAEGKATFTAKNSKITTNNGDTIYVTNTTAEINLENNTIINNDTNGKFLRIQKDSWGNTGSNGGTVTLNMTNQKASGNIVVDSISTLTINMTNNSYYEGAINNENTAKSITLKLDKTSKIKLTGDTYITLLDNADTTNSNIDFNGYKLYVNNTAIN